MRRQEKTRRALLDAATRLFSAYGFRHTSMEAIAAEAGVAKATAYAHFANKDEVFAAVVVYVADQMLERANAAAAGAKSPKDAVLASLTSKHRAMYGLVHSSRHAKELLAAMEGSGEAESAHERYLASLAKLVARCTNKKIAPRLARLLDRSADGLDAAARDVDDLESLLRLLVERVL